MIGKPAREGEDQGEGQDTDMTSPVVGCRVQVSDLTIGFSGRNNVLPVIENLFFEAC